MLLCIVNVSSQGERKMTKAVFCGAKKRFWRRDYVLILALLGSLLALTAWSGVIFRAKAQGGIVVTSTNDNGAGSLRQAILDANVNPDANTISFDGTVFNTPQTINLASPLPDITNSVIIQGPGANLLTVQRSGTAPAFRIFTIGTGLNVALSGLTIANGRAAAGDGGGISSGSNLMLTGVAVVNNQASNGGGIRLSNAGGVFTNCAISGNTAGLFGGGIFYSGGSGVLQIANSTISGNRLTSTGGLGAGISNFGSSQVTRLDVINSTIVNNIIDLRPTGGAGGIFNGTIADEQFAVTTLRNSIIAHNSLPNLRNSPRTTQTTLTSAGFNLTDDDGSGLLTQPTDILNKPAFLGLLADNGGPTPTHALLLNSPALESGDSSGFINDQRGLARPVDLPGRNASDGADIGAYEAQTVPPLPGLLISDVAASEGNSGTTNFIFNVSLTAAVAQPVTAQFATADGTATAGNDYVAANGVVTFAPGEILKTITVQVNGDTMFEPDETFFVNLSNPVNAVISDGQGQGVILDNESTVQFSAAAFVFSEDTNLTTVTVTRTGGLGDLSSVDYKTNDSFIFTDCRINSVQADQRCDYTSAAGTLNFAPGESSKTFRVLLNDDFYSENTEQITLSLSNPVNTLLGAQATALFIISGSDFFPPPGDRRFLASRLTGAQQTPPFFTNASGSGALTLVTDETQVTVEMSFSNLSGSQTAAHIHGPAPVGATAPVLFDLGTGQITNATFAVTPAQVAQLKAGLLYFDVHTANFPNGEIRGQILPNPAENARLFVRQQYHDFLSRVPDQAGEDFWTGQITTVAGTDLNAIKQRRVAVSNAFFFELEYQSTGAYTYRLYREAFGNTQPFPNPMGDMDSNPYCQANPNNCQLIRAAHVPSYERFAGDRARLDAANLAASQLALATQFATRPEFTARYPVSQTAEQFVDSLLGNIQAASGANLTSQRAALISLHNSGGRGAVLFRLAEDNQAGNPINNRAFIDAEYNRAFVTTQYFGYLRRDADLPGLNFWLSVVNQFPLRSPTGQNGMVCAFITSAEYQQRFNSYFTRTNQTDCN
jgi:hypothetical protein